MTWGKLEKRITEAIKNPNSCEPKIIICPATFDLAKQVLSDIGSSALNKPGECIDNHEFFNLAQKTGVMRILEAIIVEYEEWARSNQNVRVLPSQEGQRSITRGE